MHYAILAAGLGSRLAAEGIPQPKPLVPVGGQPLIDRLLDILLDNDAKQIAVVCRPTDDDAVARHLADLQRYGLHGRPVPLHIVRQSTASSMHSLQALSPLLAAAPFVLTTVDTVFSPSSFAAYVSAFRSAPSGLFGVTDYCDDERPLYVHADSQRRITAFTDAPCRAPYVSAGVYGLQPIHLQTLHRCIERGESRMRNFQRALLADGHRIDAWPMGTVFDVDHAADIRRAEQMMGEWGNEKMGK